MPLLNANPMNALRTTYGMLKALHTFTARFGNINIMFASEADGYIHVMPSQDNEQVLEQDAHDAKLFKNTIEDYVLTRSDDYDERMITALKSYRKHHNMI